MTAALALAREWLFGDPRGARHPVAWFGSLAAALEKRTYADSRPAGALAWVLTIGVGLGTKPDGDGVKVNELVPDRLAALSGKLQEGDVVLEVNGQRVSDREGAAAAPAARAI